MFKIKSNKSIIGSGLLNAVRSAENKEMRLRARFFAREWRMKRRFEGLMDKLYDAVSELRHLRKENKQLRRVVHYLEHLNGGITERQTRTLEKRLGMPAHVTRTSDWHKVATHGWSYVDAVAKRLAETDSYKVAK